MFELGGTVSEGTTIGWVGSGFVVNIHARGYRRLRDVDVSIGAVTAVLVEQAEALSRE